MALNRLMLGSRSGWERSSSFESTAETMNNPLMKLTQCASGSLSVSAFVSHKHTYVVCVRTAAAAAARERERVRQSLSSEVIF